MMKIISQYILKIIIVMIITQVFMITTSQASSLGDVLALGEDFIWEGRTEGWTVDSQKMQGKISEIYNILLALGIVLSVIIGAVLGVKLMFAGIEEKAKVKEMLVPYAIGCVVIFGAFGIWKLVIGFLGDVL